MILIKVKSNPIEPSNIRDTSKRNSLTYKNSATMTKNITLMVIASLFINIFGELPYGITFAISFVGVNNSALSFCIQISNILLLLPPAVELFVYYTFNKLFKSILNGAFKKVAGF